MESILKTRERDITLSALLLTACFGLCAGLIASFSATETSFLDIVDSSLGWSYMFAWSVSFYPQVVENWSRKRTIGLSSEFLLLNIIGFSCYSFYNIALYCIPWMRAQYASRHNGTSPQIAVSDIAFPLHALLLSWITAGQVIVYDGRQQMPSPTVTMPVLFIFILFLFYALMIIVLGCGAHSPLNWFTFVYVVGSVKLVVTLVKYVPQLYSNYVRKSTEGFSILQVVLDVTGSLLSLLQMMIVAAVTDDWSGICGNPVKIGLSCLGIAFAIPFCLQHYVWYARPLMYRSLELTETVDVS